MESTYSEKLVEWHFRKIRWIVSGLFGICSGFPVYVGKTSQKEERNVHWYLPQQEGSSEGIGEHSVKNRSGLRFLLLVSQCYSVALLTYSIGKDRHPNIKHSIPSRMPWVDFCGSHSCPCLGWLCRSLLPTPGASGVYGLLKPKVNFYSWSKACGRKSF